MDRREMLKLVGVGTAGFCLVPEAILAADRDGRLWTREATLDSVSARLMLYGRVEVTSLEIQRATRAGIEAKLDFELARLKEEFLQIYDRIQETHGESVDPEEWGLSE